MSQIIKGFLGIFFIVLLVVSGLSISVSMLNAANAKTFKANMITEIENSNFNYEVINECLGQGEEQGYEIEMTIYTEDIETGERNTENITDGSVNSADTKGAYMVEVLVTYINKMNIFGIQDTHQLRGYAR